MSLGFGLLKVSINWYFNPSRFSDSDCLIQIWSAIFPWTFSTYILGTFKRYSDLTLKGMMDFVSTGWLQIWSCMSLKNRPQKFLIISFFSQLYLFIDEQVAGVCGVILTLPACLRVEGWALLGNWSKRWINQHDFLASVRVGYPVGLIPGISV